MLPPRARSSDAETPQLASLIAARVRRHMPVLDGLRGIAIAVVVAHNVGMSQTSAPTPWHKLLYPIHMQGFIGVHLFFVLSGFLITGILLDTHERLRVSQVFRSF